MIAVPVLTTYRNGVYIAMVADSTNPRMYLCVVTAIKNEAAYLAEWLAHGINLGADRAYLFEELL